MHSALPPQVLYSIYILATALYRVCIVTICTIIVLYKTTVARSPYSYTIIACIQAHLYLLYMQYVDQCYLCLINALIYSNYTQLI